MSLTIDIIFGIFCSYRLQQFLLNFISNLRRYSSIGHMGRVGGVYSGLCARSQLVDPMPPIKRESCDEVRNMLLHRVYYIPGHVL